MLIYEDIYMVIIAVGFLALGGLNLIYAFYSTHERRSIVAVRGLICSYIALIYLGYAYRILVEPESMRYFMRGAILVVGVLFALDTVLMIRHKDEK